MCKINNVIIAKIYKLAEDRNKYYFHFQVWIYDNVLFSPFISCQPQTAMSSIGIGITVAHQRNVTCEVEWLLQCVASYFLQQSHCDHYSRVQWSTSFVLGYMAHRLLSLSPSSDVLLSFPYLFFSFLSFLLSLLLVSLYLNIIT